ncbi:sigma factor-like helix-turn-helix DNA-binding protein [Streptomyces uncialis]|uniref:sigma factor-like helix-turn-helix DNA-binding protein n=1 Tax=Streptomyces uncialis TaxID=1048205 RepID=UPI0038165F40
MGDASHPPRHPALGDPLDYLAFRELVHDAYTRYAHARIGQAPLARTAVNTAFAAIRRTWTRTLSTPSAPRTAWRLLHRTVTCYADAVPGSASIAHRLLEPAPADAVLLHRRLGMSLAKTADVMGVDASAVRALLARADRRLDRLPDERPRTR